MATGRSGGGLEGAPRGGGWCLLEGLYHQSRQTGMLEYVYRRYKTREREPVGGKHRSFSQWRNLDRPLGSGCYALAFGLWLLFDRNNLFCVLFSSGENQLVVCVSFMLLGVGSLIIFTSVVGFLGKVKKIRCLLVTYVCFQVLVFFTQIAMSALIFLKKEVVYHQWNNRIDEVISDYGNKSLAEKEPVWNILNAMQQNMECCGRYNVTQWEKNKNKEKHAQVPCSCTKSSLNKWFCDIPRNSTYTMGCEEYLDTWFENNVLILNGINISLLITQVVVITLSMKLFMNIRRNSIWPN